MFKRLTDRITTWWAGLSDREKRMVLGIGGGAVAVLTITIILGISAGISERKSRIIDKEKILNEIISLRGEYRNADSNIKMMEMRLKGNSVNLFSYIEDLAKRMGVEVTDMNERTKGGDKDSKIKEIMVEVTINKVTQDRLVDFLSKLEGGPELVKVTQLRLRARNDKQQKLIDANVTVSTYKAGS